MPGRRFREGVFGGRFRASPVEPVARPSTRNVGTDALNQFSQLIGYDDTKQALGSAAAGEGLDLSGFMGTEGPSGIAAGAQIIDMLAGGLGGGKLQEAANSTLGEMPVPSALGGLLRDAQGPEGTELRDSYIDSRPSAEEARAAADDAVTLISEDEQLDEFAQGIQDPLTLEAIANRRQEISAQLQDNARLLRQQQDAARVQDAIFQFQAAQLGLDPDVGPLMDALDADGSHVGMETFDAVMATLADENLTAGQKEDTVNLLANRLDYGGAVLAEIETLVQNEQDLNAILDDPEAELLTDDFTYMHPLFEHSLVADPVERVTLNFQSAFDSAFPDFDASGNPEAQDAWIGAMNASLSGEININHPSLRILSQIMAVTPGKLLEAFEGAAASTMNSEAELEGYVEADFLKPGMEGLMYAAQEAALNVGFDPVEAQLFANSKALHSIIDRKSKGHAGQEGSGTLRGVGGLTEHTYEILMGESWSPSKGMLWELEALAKWIGFGFNGDIREAVEYYYRTGDWGGTAALPAEGGA